MDRLLPALMFPPAAVSRVELSPGRRTFEVEGRVQAIWGPAESAPIGAADVLNGRAFIYGTQVDVTRETYNYGKWIASASFSNRTGQLLESLASVSPGSQATTSRITLQNLGFPLTSATLVDLSVGDISLDVVRTMQSSGRFGFGGRSALRGVSGAFRSTEQQFELRVGVAERGRLTSLLYSGFVPTLGTLSWLGMGYRFGPGFSVGIQAIRASRLSDEHGQDAPITQAAQTSFGRVTTVTTADRAASTLVIALSRGELSLPLPASGAWAGRIVGMLNGVNSTDSSIGGTRAGLFGDVRYRFGSFTHDVAVRLADRGLLFADRYLISATKGASWAVATDRARTSWAVNIDYSQFGGDALGDAPTRQLSLRADGSWRFGKEQSVYVAGAASLERSETSGSNSQESSATSLSRRAMSLTSGYRFPIVGYGVSSLNGTLRQNEVLVTNGTRASGWQLAWDHEWFRHRRDTNSVQVRTGLGYAFDRSTTDLRRYPTASISFRSPTASDWVFDGALRYSSPSGNLTVERGLSGSLTATRRLDGNWTAGITASVNEAQLDVALALTNPNVPALLTRRSERSGIFWLRWDASRGSPYVPQGQRTFGVAGAGAIVGSVTCAEISPAANQPTGPRGLAGVVIWLDDRYSAVTDADGRFEFPLVPVGAHRVRIGLESVPLPWELESEGRISLDVSLRGKVEAQFRLRKIVEPD